MKIFSRKKEITLSASLSLLAHLFAIALISSGGSYRFTTPVETQAVMELQVGGGVERAQEQKSPKYVPTPPQASPAANGRPQESSQNVAEAGTGKAEEEDGDDKGGGALPAGPVTTARNDGSAPAAPIPLAGDVGRPDGAEPAKIRSVAVDLAAAQPAKRTEPGGTGREKLTYRVSFLGVPVGGALLEARREGEMVRITSTMRSNALAAGLYPVDDSAESRVIADRYVISTMRQQEGAYRSDTGFTLCLRERKVFWMDRLHKLTVTEPLLDDQATDILSALYMLRKQPLQVGKSAEMHVFDSNRSVVVAVEVLRRERVRLPGGQDVTALVVRPGLQAKGLFQRTGEVLIWLTDDAYKVPVRLETTIAVGNVTAELVSAEADLDNVMSGR